jgi:flagellar biosynthesis protein FlhB
MPDEQTEKATAQRRQKAREEGQIVRSRELTGSIVMLAGTLFLGWFSSSFVTHWKAAMFSLLEEASNSDLSLQGGSQAYAMFRSLVSSMMLPVLLLMVGLFCVAALVNVAQSGGIAIRQNAFEPNFSRLSPTNYFSQVFSFQGLTRILKSLVPSVLLGWLAVRLLSSEYNGMPLFSLMRLPQMFSDAHTLLLQASFITLAWSAIDYGSEWWANEKRLRMSKQDIREEMKQNQGNPQVRGRIRSIQRQLRQRKLRGDVAKASVVITNPTHYAVALEFSMETMQAPKVLAKGRNLIAQMIKEEARLANIPIVENPPLARSLYRSVEVGQSIPQDLYAVVAEILAFLYRTELERSAREKSNAASAQSAARRAPVVRPPMPYMLEEEVVPAQARPSGAGIEGNEIDGSQERA